MDHNPMIINVPMSLEKFGKVFQIFNYMLDNPGFIEAISSAWIQPLYADPMSILCRKLKLVRQALID